MEDHPFRPAANAPTICVEPVGNPKDPGWVVQCGRPRSEHESAAPIDAKTRDLCPCPDCAERRDR